MQTSTKPDISNDISGKNNFSGEERSTTDATLGLRINSIPSEAGAPQIPDTKPNPIDEPTLLKQEHTAELIPQGQGQEQVTFLPSQKPDSFPESPLTQPLILSISSDRKTDLSVSMKRPSIVNAAAIKYTPEKSENKHEQNKCQITDNHFVFWKSDSRHTKASTNARFPSNYFIYSLTGIILFITIAAIIHYACKNADALNTPTPSP